MPAHFAFKPRSKAYIAPPIMVPFSLFTLYLTPISVSAYLVAIPKIPVIHIQNTDPGPPIAMAVPTPMILPVPIVEESAVVRAPNWETSPSESSSAVTDILIALKMSFWINPVRIVIKMWVPNRRMIRGHPHKKLSTVLMIVANIEISPSFTVCAAIDLLPAPVQPIFTSALQRVKYRSGTNLSHHRAKV